MNTPESKISYRYYFSHKNGEELKISPEQTLTQTFEPICGKLIVALWIRMDIHNTGVNPITLYGNTPDQEEVPILQVDTEGAYFYAYDGTIKTKLSHFQSDDWYSLYLSIDTDTNTYSLYIDGERLMYQASLLQPIQNVHSFSIGSHGGILYVKRLAIYPAVLPSLETTACDKPIFDVKAMGIASDGVAVATEQLQKVIDECSKTNGIVYLRDGIYLTGMLELKDNVTLYIDEDATLKGVLDLASYPVRLSEKHPNWNTYVQGPQKALIYADSKENITILGGGTIDGSGDFPGAYGSESLRVSAILLVGCPHVRLEHLYIKDAGMWTVPLVECDDLYIHDLNINSTWYPNRDGIDLCDCQRVFIENCNIKADDDALCMKSGNECGCDELQVQDCFIISTMANGIKFGTYSYGGFTHCHFSNCIIKDTRTCAIAIQCVDGGRIEHLYFDEITIQNVESVFFIIIADKERVPEDYAHRIGSIQNIYFRNIIAEGVRRSYGSYLGGFEKAGSRYPIENIFFSHVNVVYKGGISETPASPEEFGHQYPESNCFGLLPASGYYIRHASNVVFEDCQTLVALPDCRPIYLADDACDVVVNGITIK